VEETIRRLTRILGATNVQAAGHDSMFEVRDQHGAVLRCDIKLSTQHLMLVLLDPTGVTRCSLDMGPVSEAFEHPDVRGRVTLRIGNQLIHLDGQPSVGIEIESIAVQDRNKSQRLLARRVHEVT
jgi:hypothetical protein